MAIVIGVAGEGDIVAVLEADQPPHRVSRRRIHANAAIPVQSHEAERRVHHLADRGQIELVALGDPGPVMNAGAAQRIRAHANAGDPNGIEIDHAAKIVDVGAHEVMLARGR